MQEKQTDRFTRTEQTKRAEQTEQTKRTACAKQAKQTEQSERATRAKRTGERKRKGRGGLWTGTALLLAAALWTALCALVDVSPIGPLGSYVGFSTVNGAVREALGTRMWLYRGTDLVSLLPIAVAAGFAALGLWEWIKRRSIRKVDRDLLWMGVFFLALAAVYVFFECVPVNFRPVLIEGRQEASYPSSTTLLSLSVSGAAGIFFHRRVKGRRMRRAISVALGAVSAFLVAGRVLSGVHWITDIVGGCLFSASLVALYAFFSRERGGTGTP